MIPYGRQSITDEDIQEVVDVLKSDWLTTGPAVKRFEEAVAEVSGVAHGIAVSSGTAALHAIMHALEIGPGDEVIVPALTFAATANSVVYVGGTPVFADVCESTLLIDPASVEALVTDNTKAIVGVDYAGQPCDWDALRAIADKYGVALVADACHSIGGSYKSRPVGTLADLSAYSFHPVKHVACGEGGMVVTDDDELARRCQVFRNHGITTDARQRESSNAWFYEMVELGFNYRLTDIQCALGASQVKRLAESVERRNAIARRYMEAFLEVDGVTPLECSPDVLNAYHLFVVKFDGDGVRDAMFSYLREREIGVNVHYIPVHLHPFYRERGEEPGQCPVAEKVYGQILSLPMFPGLTDEDMDTVLNTIREGLRSV